MTDTKSAEVFIAQPVNLRDPPHLRGGCKRRSPTLPLRDQINLTQRTRPREAMPRKTFRRETGSPQTGAQPEAFAEASYARYDASDGFGRWEQWEQAAGSASGRLGFTRDTSGWTPADRDARGARLSSLPANVTELKSAFRRKAFAAHPDYGGTSEMFRASTRLRRLLQATRRTHDAHSCAVVDHRK